MSFVEVLERHAKHHWQSYYNAASNRTGVLLAVEPPGDTAGRLNARLKPRDSSSSPQR